MKYAHRLSFLRRGACTALAILLGISGPAAAQHGHSGGAHEASANVSTLEPWLGTWRSGDLFIGDAMLQPIYDAVAARLPGWSASDVRNWAFDIRRDDFGAIRIENHWVTFLEDDMQTVLCRGRYEHRGNPVLSNGPTKLTTAAFELVNAAEGDCARYRYLLLVGVHGVSDGWHLRYGGDGFEPLQADAWGGWWPVVMVRDATARTLLERWSTHIDDFVDQIHGKAPSRRRPARPYD